MPGNPKAALLILQSGGEGVLYRWEAGRLDPAPFSQPEGKRYPYDLRLMGKALYLAASDGIWRYDAKGHWEQLDETIYSRFVPDSQKPGVLWAVSMLGGNFSGGASQIARIEAG